jgi:hypothetical protein
MPCGWRRPAHPSPTFVARRAFAEATFYLWKKKFGSLGIPEVPELRQMRDETAPLKRLVADLTLGGRASSRMPSHTREKALVRV